MKTVPKELDPPQFYPIFIKLFPLLLFTTVLGCMLYQPILNLAIEDWLPKVIFLEIFIIMKLAAPRIPIWQLAFVLSLILVISMSLDYLGFNVNPLFFLAGNFVFPVICVFGFGQYWVSKQYIPRWANMW